MELTFWTVLKIGMAWVLAPILVGFLVFALVFIIMLSYEYRSSFKRRRK